ncbi:hypothetical protein F3Y22_tig00116925pilonHSYRG00047 [Hibiscus syriacus]|uniref:Reverse transcriptase Ty1/copia-type domain-containing protein n=1 Tax=Hibiscus syriacus TaxID=106335 RepID=A0A6A2WMT7_HIBSY|nr:hypothetical protein F3Y22_tig00116925pilonHSYRG00047 [Hibiscus syriacus]
MAKLIRHFKNNVPIVAYEDIKPYIDRIANATLVTSTKNVKNGAYVHQTDTETPCGLKASSLSTSLYKEECFRNIISQHHTSPIESIFCSDPKQSMYCQLLTGLIKRDEVRIISAAFSAALLRAIKFLEDYWTELCSNIRSGQLSDWITNSGCRNVISSTMEPNPQSAESIQNICVMSQYVETLKIYSGGLPIVSGMYVSSEAFCGINLDLLSEPSCASYTFLPSMAYFEFLPLDKDNLTVIISIQSRRRSKSDRISQHDTSIPIRRETESRAVTEAKTLVEPLGFIFRGYTSYADTTSIPGHYVLFWELKAKEGNEREEVDPNIMEDCCYRMEESLGILLLDEATSVVDTESERVGQETLDAVMVNQQPLREGYEKLICLSQGLRHWKRSMMLALSAKNKLDFIDGSIQAPDSSMVNQFNAWTRANNLVNSWLLNSVSKDIVASLLYHTTAAEILLNLGPSSSDWEGLFLCPTDSNGGAFLGPTDSTDSVSPESADSYDDVKYNVDGSVDHCKARLVAKGFTQVEGIDYMDTFSHVAKMTSFRVLLSLAATHKWHLLHLDLNNVFLNGTLDEEVYMKLPPGYKSELKGSNMQSPFEHSLFTKGCGNGFIALLVYVDDIVLAGEDLQALHEIQNYSSCPDTRRSTTGFCAFFGNSFVSWKSKKQAVVSRSSCEAEYRAMAMVAINLATHQVFHERTKHIEVYYHFVRDKVKASFLKLFHVRSSYQLADIFTKTLRPPIHRCFNAKLGPFNIHAHPA